MRIPIAYYLMLLYVTVMLKPLIPIVSDALSHTFSEAIHIATVHAIYGSNHLEKELSDTSPDNASNKHQSNANTEDQVQAHLCADECLYSFSGNRANNHSFFLKRSKLKAGFILKYSPPPKFS